MNALILGGSRGVGFAISEQFATVFQNICIASRSKENLESAKKVLSKINSFIFDSISISIFIFAVILLLLSCF